MHKTCTRRDRKEADRQVSGVDFWLKRRRYGSTAFCWVDLSLPGSQDVFSAGDPFQKINPSKCDLDELITQLKSQLEESRGSNGA